MTTSANNIIKKQITHSMTQEQAVLAAYAEQDGDILMIDATGLSIYDAASEADETGVWVFLGNAINQGSIYGDWQQNPSVEHNMPDDIALGVADKSEWMGTGAKWLLGGLTAVGLLALGGAMGGGGGSSHQDDYHTQASNNIPKPRALVQQFSVAENPTNPEERAAVVQAEVPAETNTQPENHALLNEPIIRELDEAQTNLNNLPETDIHTTDNAVNYVASEHLFFPNDWLNANHAEMVAVV